ncbi:precorrin-6y C5,15-methyltransferase (decarboxylating) subunit CbiE [Rhizobium sp. KVB221]|uniref:Precorrin-6y C5,15-methyltransferase (Decarboxylating) subunit CbiE n=1 Tax=Rhizobium setariae TaxID=2801340 RepID=A0A936YVR2_9HYPH|nr:precorrin-6y C5,15-methyltransferase (decarboxylating) subunit CbiE [Rhizobium setariae]MBL0373935.1 precorrin-6y C5,15-methyltransferase (decarboxylating) subunit CbiE [Rhizobium setariae]
MSDPSNSSIAPLRWLTIVGIGEDGIAGLGDDAKRRIAGAEFIFGGKRHLELAQSLISGETNAWTSPLDGSIEQIKSLRGRGVVVLASGDPFLYGMGATLSRFIDVTEMISLPAPSSFSLAASRLGWPLQDTATVSLHGRPLDLVRPYLQPGAKILALTSDADGPAALARLLTETGFGLSVLHVLEVLGGSSERKSRLIAKDFVPYEINALNVCAIEVICAGNARVLPLSTGLDDALFEHDGQITKREIRAVTLSSLAPRRGELLWDIGAGSGSISIEWMLCDPAMRAIAIEANPERAERIGRNARMFGVPGLKIVEGSAPAALDGVPAPDAIFIGGGGSDPDVLDRAIGALKNGGRLVANAVTTEMEVLLLGYHKRLGGNLIRIDVARASPVGGMTGWRPAMPVTQWSWAKPA